MLASPKVWDPQHGEGRGQRSHGPVIAKFLCSNSSWLRSPTPELRGASHRTKKAVTVHFSSTCAAVVQLAGRDGVAMISLAGAPEPAVDRKREAPGSRGQRRCGTAPITADRPLVGSSTLLGFRWPVAVTMKGAPVFRERHHSLCLSGATALSSRCRSQEGRWIRVR